MVIALVGGPCYPSLFSPANPECVAIGECNKNVYSPTSCIVKSATTLKKTVNPSYYLLEQVGGLLLDIANPRERFFIWPFL